MIYIYILNLYAYVFFKINMTLLIMIFYNDLYIFKFVNIIVNIICTLILQYGVYRE